MIPFCFYCDRRFPGRQGAAELDRHMVRACRLAPAIARYRTPPAPLENDDMSRKRTRENTAAAGMPEPTEGPSGDFPEFLRASDLGRKEGARGTITFLGKPGRKIESQFGVQYAFPVKFKGKVYDWPVRIDSGNHRRMFDRFGKKTPKGSVNVELKTYNRNLYIAIV